MFDYGDHGSDEEETTVLARVATPMFDQAKDAADFNPIEICITDKGEAALRRANPQLSITIDAPP